MQSFLLSIPLLLTEVFTHGDFFMQLTTSSILTNFPFASTSIPNHVDVSRPRVSSQILAEVHDFLTSKQYFPI